MSDNKTESLDEKTIQDVVNASHGYADAVARMSQVSKESEELSKYINGDVHLIEQRLEKYATLDELTNDIQKNKNHVDDFFLNEDGTPMEIYTGEEKISTKDTDKNSYDLKSNILIYLKQAAIWKAEMEVELEQFDEERKKIEDSMGVSVNEIVINQLQLAMEKRKELQAEGVQAPRHVVKHIDHVISGFDFSIELQTIRELPSITKNTLLEFKKEHMIHSYGKRYRSAIKKSNSIATLISFIANSPASSFEEIYLPPDKYKKGYENLFLFSLIRYFAVGYWTNDTKVMHAMTISLLQQFVNDELPRELKNEFIENINNYLSVFYKELD